MISRPKGFAFAAALAMVLASPSTASANAGYPMMLAVWPALWMAILPVIALEALIAAHVLGLRPLEALRISSVANAASALVGVPLTWVALALLRPNLEADWPPIGWRWRDAVLTTLGSPWLGGYEDGQTWKVFAAGASLCVPFFLASVASEALVARRFLPIADRPRAWRWAWIGNASSYGIIVILLLACAIRAGRSSSG